MITRTAKEIIKNAYFYANSKNTKITSFYENTLLLNNIYGELYIDLVKQADDYIKYADYTPPEMEIPSDCYLIMAVYQVCGDGNLEEVQSLPKNQVIKGNYYKIENNTLKILNPSGTYRIKYSTMPPTLTAPDDMEELSISSYTSIGAMDEDGFYYIQKDPDTTYHYYNFNTEVDTELEFEEYKSAPTTWDYLDGTLTFDTDTKVITYNGEECSYFDRDDTTITNIVVCDPYAMVSYSDGLIYIFTGFDGVLWNPKAYTGHKTTGKVVALYTNDSTGKGCVYEYNSKLYYASFIPDTVLSYPSNVFFNLIEYKLASQLQALNGLDNSYINQTLIPQAEVSFEKVIKRDTRPYRFENVIPRRAWL